MLKSTNKPDIIKDIPQSCFDTAAAEINKITCYDIPEPKFENPRTVKWRADKVARNSYCYVIMDGKYYEQCDDYERGISYHDIGDTEDDMIAHLIYEALWDFAIHNASERGLYGGDGVSEAELITTRCFAQCPERYRLYFERRIDQLQMLKGI